MDTEDRELFVKKLDEIDVRTPSSIAIHGVEDSIEAAGKLGISHNYKGCIYSWEDREAVLHQILKN